jgi:hypothetical protein
MSWDIFVQDLPQEAKSIEDIPSTFKPRSIGRRSEIIERIKEVVPDADFANPAWGKIDGNGWSIELNMGDEEDCSSFAFHVRGDDAAAGIIAAILDHLRLRALDASRGDFFAPGEQAVASFRRWRQYRDHVAKQPGKSID